MIIDLTMELSDQTPVFPGSQTIDMKSVAQIQKDGWNETRLCMNSHIGTHIDAPYHMIEKGKTISEYPIDYFCGNGIVFDVRHEDEIEIDPSFIQGHEIVFFYTGHNKTMHKKTYFDSSPVLSKNTADALLKKHIKLVGIDSWTIDEAPYTIHRLLLSHDILILENLVSLDRLLNKQFLCYALPLPISQADGAPCRVIAVL